VFLHRHPALLRDPLRRDFTIAALGGRINVVPLKRVKASEEVATSIAEMDLQRVRLRGLAVPLKLLKVFELRVRAEATLDRLDRPTCKVGLRSLKEQPVRRLESAGYLEKLCRLFLLLFLHHAVDTVHRFLTNTPLDPSRRPVRRFHRPTLLETRSQQGLVVKSVRIRGREPLRSASRLLGFIIILCNWDPGHKVVAGPIRGPLYFPDPRSRAPGSFQGQRIVGIDSHLASIALGLLRLTGAFPEGRGGCVSRHRV
jgi:hypothetical protein